MNTQTAIDTTLGTLARQRPASIPVFERHNLDYCCGGGRSLAAACRDRDLEPAAILDEIAAAEATTEPDERSWEDASMTELADHIERTHHAFMRDALTRLGNVIPRVVTAHGDRHPELHALAEVFKTFRDEMNDHMAQEETIVFPWLRRLETPAEDQDNPAWSVKRPIDCMRHDHDDAGEALAAFRSLTGNYAVPEGVCNTYRSMLRILAELERDTHIHIHKENNILFPAGIAAEERAGPRVP